MLAIEDVLEEPVIDPPLTLEFRPGTSTGHPNRRNNMTLYVNPQVITAGHHVRVAIVRRTGAIDLLDDTGVPVQELDVKLTPERHGIRGQNVFRIRIPWRGTAWSQRALVEAKAKAGPEKIVVQGHVRLDEPDPNEGGFFREVKFDELDNTVPSMFAGGVITVNMLDPLNRVVFGTGADKEEAKKEFDRRIIRDAQAQQRLATLLLEEMSFRTLQQLLEDNKLHLPSKREIDAIHVEIDRHKFKLAADVYRALVR